LFRFRPRSQGRAGAAEHQQSLTVLELVFEVNEKEAGETNEETQRAIEKKAKVAISGFLPRFC
jgi:hypothetical protein